VGYTTDSTYCNRQEDSYYLISGYHSTRSDLSHFLIDITVPVLAALGQQHALLEGGVVGQGKVVELLLQLVDLVAGHPAHCHLRDGILVVGPLDVRLTRLTALNNNVETLSK
jgi:hypothetical protein